MAIIRKNKLREASDNELEAKLLEYRRELNSERGMLATGGRTSNPGKISELKRTVARVLTIMTERKLGINTKKAAPKGAEQKAPAGEKKN